MYRMWLLHAMNQMRGGFSRELSALREKLLHLTSLMELTPEQVAEIRRTAKRRFLQAVTGNLVSRQISVWNGVPIQ